MNKQQESNKELSLIEQQVLLQKIQSLTKENLFLKKRLEATDDQLNLIDDGISQLMDSYKQEIQTLQSQLHLKNKIIDDLAQNKHTSQQLQKSFKENYFALTPKEQIKKIQNNDSTTQVSISKLSDEKDAPQSEKEIPKEPTSDRYKILQQLVYLVEQKDTPKGMVIINQTELQQQDLENPEKQDSKKQDTNNNSHDQNTNQKPEKNFFNDPENALSMSCSPVLLMNSNKQATTGKNQDKNENTQQNKPNQYFVSNFIQPNKKKPETIRTNYQMPSPPEVFIFVKNASQGSISNPINDNMMQRCSSPYYYNNSTRNIKFIHPIPSKSSTNFYQNH